MKERHGPELRSPAASAAESHQNRLSASAKKWIKRGFKIALIGGGVLLAAHLLVPIIPLHAATKFALGVHGDFWGKVILGIGAGTAVVGAGIGVLDAARGIGLAPAGGH